nr:zinc ABC transporter substrate-binding protein [Spirochaetales bacterium]
GVDPHFWVSPLRARIIAKEIRDFLSEKDPARKDEYWKNHLQLDSVIMDTDAYMKSLLDNTANKSFMIFHPSLSYLAMDYGLEQIAVETEGKEPSPSDLKRLIDKGREKNIKAIMVQREFDKRNADLIADEIAAETIIIDPLGYDWVSSVRTIAESIAGKYN